MKLKTTGSISAYFIRNTSLHLFHTTQVDKILEISSAVGIKTMKNILRASFSIDSNAKSNPVPSLTPHLTISRFIT
jgi:hypothetical protein